MRRSSVLHVLLRTIFPTPLWFKGKRGRRFGFRGRPLSCGVEPGVLPTLQRVAERSLAALHLSSLQWLEGGGSLRGAPGACGIFWKDPRWRDVACSCRRLVREDPLTLSGDERGRGRQLEADLLKGGSVSAADRNWWYGPADVDSGSTVPFVAARFGLPDRAAIVRIEDWFDAELREKWRNRECESAPAAKEVLGGFFRVPIGEWRSAVCRVMRAGLLAMFPGSEARPAESAGAFAVPKSSTEDRLIGDRRPRNAMEEQARAPLLPYGPRLRHLRLRHGEGLHAPTHDLRHCFYLGASENRLRKQMIGPRMPSEWLEHHDDEGRDHPSFLRGLW